MPLLLEDLAEETSASNRRTADRLDEETRELERLGKAVNALDGLQRRIVSSARDATDHAISRLPQAEGIWRSAIASLPAISTEDSVQLLRHLLATFEAGQRLARSPRAMWNLVVPFGISPERIDELMEAERRFDELAREARRALEHRTSGWQPSDPDRLALGLRLAQEGKTVKPEVARAWFRRTQR